MRFLRFCLIIRIVARTTTANPRLLRNYSCDGQGQQHSTAASPSSSPTPATSCRTFAVSVLRSCLRGYYLDTLEKIQRYYKIILLIFKFKFKKKKIFFLIIFLKFLWSKRHLETSLNTENSSDLSLDYNGSNFSVTIFF